MSITPYQIVVPLVSFLALLYAWNLAVKRKKTVWETILWTVFWGGIAALAFFPQMLGYLTLVTGIKSQVNAILVTAIGILFFMMFYVILRLEELQQRQTKMIRGVALQQWDERGGERSDAPPRA